MNAQRQRKEATVSELQTLFANSEIVVLTHYDGCTVSDLTALRDQLAANGGTFRVTKNRLARRALEGTKAAPLGALFSGPTAIASSDDSAQISQIPKVIVEFGKINENIRVLGGVMDGALLDADEIKHLASLPSMNDLRAKLIGLINSPAIKLITLFNQPASKLARLMALRETSAKKER